VFSLVNYAEKELVPVLQKPFTKIEGVILPKAFIKPVLHRYSTRQGHHKGRKLETMSTMHMQFKSSTEHWQTKSSKS
jgi:hypothetical protein